MAENNKDVSFQFHLTPFKGGFKQMSFFFGKFSTL